MDSVRRRRLQTVPPTPGARFTGTTAPGLTFDGYVHSNRRAVARAHARKLPRPAPSFVPPPSLKPASGRANPRLRSDSRLTVADPGSSPSHAQNHKSLRNNILYRPPTQAPDRSGRQSKRHPIDTLCRARVSGSSGPRQKKGSRRSTFRAEGPILEHGGQRRTFAHRERTSLRSPVDGPGSAPSRFMARRLSTGVRRC